MTNLFDYLKWRGDIPMTQVPFCPVDGLILSTLVYVHFDGLVPAALDGAVSIGDMAAAYLALPEDKRGGCRVKSDLVLLKALTEAPRFSALKLCFYEDRFSEQEELQFSATAVLPGDGSAFLAFRGTDCTLVGWKEDFNMSFQDSVPAQRAAVEYVNRFAASYTCPLRLGGHSKGGNLAVFAAALCAPAVQDRILAVYNNDGPGFTSQVLKAPGYREILPRVHTYIPQSSVIGMLLEHEEDYTVVKSHQVGILQHDPYSWEIMGGDFVRLEEVTDKSRLTDLTVKTWLSGLTKEERSRFVDTVFDLLSAGDISSTSELFRPRNVYAAFQALIHTDDETRRLLSDTLSQLIRSAAEVLRKERMEADTTDLQA